MRFKITGDHRKAFEKQRFIEFENLFSLEELEEVSQHIDAVLSKRARKLIETLSPTELYGVGRDLFRDDPEIQNFITHSTLAQIGGQLFGSSMLSIAYDQVLRTTTQTLFPTAKSCTLSQKTCIQPLAGAVIIRLSGDALPAPFLPQNPQNAVFISPSLLIPWEIFFQQPQHSFLLIVYASPKARYVFEKNDSHTHDLKKLGYGFGDQLGSKHHLVVYRP